MTSERRRQVEALYRSALARSANERPAFLADACANDEDLRRQLESLLDAPATTDGAFAGPALAITTQMVSDPAASFLIGRQLGVYRLVEHIGSGGMGDVYRARDTRLGRDVAIKVLPLEFNDHDESLARFEREARVLASLNHPNIATIHAVEENDGLRGIVMELVEGETLAQRISHGPIPIKSALDMASQMAKALESAHDKGIVHRDLKPANVKVALDGSIKVLDFGLAKLDKAKAPRPSTEAPTIVIDVTQEGRILGTAAYMSPEHVRGQLVDQRTDIWAFGCVLYEMLAGRAVFARKTPSDTVAAVLDREPDWTALPWTPPTIFRLLQRCLEKEAGARLQHLSAANETIRQTLDELKSKHPRYQSVRDLGFRLRLLSHPVASLSWASTFARPLRRWWVAAAAITAIVGLITVVTPRLLRTQGGALADRDVIVLADFANVTGEPVFDGTLKVALAVALEQSPFLKVFSDQRVQETLRLMGLPPNERVTMAVAREVARREQLKALIAGSVSKLGTRYVLGLEAINAETGDVVARNQVEVASREEVIGALGGATARLRERLGESLASIERFDVPLARATTPSLDALHAYSLALDQGRFVPRPEAIPHLMRAIELDPSFALALAQLSGVYANTGQAARAPELSRRAFELRDRVSERERFFIAWRYYVDAVQAWDKALELARSWTAMYPRESFAFNSLGLAYGRIGQHGQAVEALREAIRLDPPFVPPYNNLAVAFLALNKLDEAKATLRKSEELGFESLGLRRIGFLLAFMQGDQETMARQLKSSNSVGDSITLAWLAHASAFSGRLKAAHDQFRRAIQLALQEEFKERAAQLSAEDAEAHAVVGQCEQARREVQAALTLSRDNFTLENAGRILALCGRPTESAVLSKELVDRLPEATLVAHMAIPVTSAAVALEQGDAVRAIEVLEGAIHYERALGTDFWPMYLRGLAHLRLKAGREAAVQFQNVLDHRGASPTSALYPLAHLGLARAAMLTNDTGRARKAYEDFLALWTEADPDLPAFREAGEELARLRASQPPSS